MTCSVKIGDMVRLGVWVCGEWQPMSLGKVTAIRDGYIEADVMGIHGGAPWIQTSQNYHYMLESEYQDSQKEVI